jgi:glycosyltransferase involved in cell wall biosynthesis
MIASQARFLRNEGYDVNVCCAKFGRGATVEFAGIRRWSIPRPLNALLPSPSRERIYISRVGRMRGDGLLIDHGESIADADIGYVHNYLAPDFASRMTDYFSNDRLPWRGPDTRTRLIANSRLVRRALVATLDLPADRVVLNYPGYDDRRFSPETRNAMRDGARCELGVGPEETLVGLVTSGDFHKRGLDRFVECFATLNGRIPRLRGFVLGGRRTPAVLADDVHYQSGRIVHRPVTGTPERFTAALDLVLYPARYEEFGIVVLEAMAMGIPVVTSSAVGAAELLLEAAAGLVIDAGEDSVEAYCARAIELLGTEASAGSRLASELVDLARDYSQGQHNARLASLIRNIET